MNKIFCTLIAGTLLLVSGCRTAPATEQSAKRKLMWLDCSANWERFSDPDSIRYYAAKCREAGMTALVLDMKGTSSEVVWPSDEAPQLKEWKGVVRPDFDFVGTFIRAARDNGLEIYGSFNTFAEGHGIFRRGLIYEHPEWQSVNYIPGKGLVPQLEIPGKSVLFTNPALPEVQEHEIALFTEVAQRYDLDGILLDRGRYDNIQSDFSDFSRRAFEAYIGQPVERFPEDIYAWEPDGEGGWKRTDGPWFKKWIEWRASVIHGFFARTKEALAAANPRLKFGAYTGAWYLARHARGVPPGLEKAPERNRQRGLRGRPPVGRGRMPLLAPPAGRTAFHRRHVRRGLQTRHRAVQAGRGDEPPRIGRTDGLRHRAHHQPRLVGTAPPRHRGRGDGRNGKPIGHATPAHTPAAGMR